MHSLGRQEADPSGPDLESVGGEPILIGRSPKPGEQNLLLRNPMNGYGAAQLAASFRTVRKNTIQVAQDIPESKYDFAPAPGMRPVGDVLKHIALSPRMYEDMHRVKKITTLQGYDFGAAMAGAREEEKKPRSKDEIIALLESEGERFASWLETLTPAFLAETFTDPMGQNPRTRLEHLLSPKEHE